MLCWDKHYDHALVLNQAMLCVMKSGKGALCHAFFDHDFMCHNEWGCLFLMSYPYGSCSNNDMHPHSRRHHTGAGSQCWGI